MMTHDTQDELLRILFRLERITAVIKRNSRNLQDETWYVLTIDLSVAMDRVRSVLKTDMRDSDIDIALQAY